MRHSLLALSLLGLATVGLLLVAPAGRHAEAGIDRCMVSQALASFDLPLPHVTKALADGSPFTIIAFGSSSTYGTGASSQERSYPSRLAAMLELRYPDAGITVMNRGVGGETAGTTLDRIETDVLADRPTLVIWQVGTNDVLKDIDPAQTAKVLRAGLKRLKKAGVDVVLMDVQYAPAILQHPHFRETERVIASEARALNVPVIHRFAMMREWADEGRMPLSVMLSDDRLHMTDASYDCLARQIGRAIVAVGSPVRS